MHRDWQAVHLDLQNKACNPGVSPTYKRLLNRIQPFPRTLGDLTRIFTTIVKPCEPDVNVIWGVLDLNISVSLCPSSCVTLY